MDVTRYARFQRPGHARHRRPPHARAPDAPRRGSATTTCTRSSTTTPGSPTSSSTTTSAPRPSPASSSGRSPSSPSTGSSAKRLMTDNAWSYIKNRSLRELLAAPRDPPPAPPSPYRPRTNGKVERFHQTMAREWAYGLAYRSPTPRRRRCHTGSTTTTSADHTARSETGHRSAAFTTSVGRTASRSLCDARNWDRARNCARAALGSTRSAPVAIAVSSSRRVRVTARGTSAAS